MKMIKKSLLGSLAFGLLSASLVLAGCSQPATDKDIAASADETATTVEQSRDTATSAAQSEDTSSKVVKAEDITRVLEDNGLDCSEESVDITDVTSAWACGAGETQILVREFTEPALATAYARETLTVDACAVDSVKEFRWVMGGPAWIVYSENPLDSQTHLLDMVRDELKFEDHKEIC